MNRDSGDAPSEVEIIFRAMGSKRLDVAMTVGLEFQISQVKAMLQISYPSNPSPERLKVLFTERVLDDKERVRDILAKKDLEEQVIFHLIIQEPQPGDAEMMAERQLPNAVRGGNAQPGQQLHRMQIKLKQHRKKIRSTDEFKSMEQGIYHQYRESKAHLTEIFPENARLSTKLYKGNEELLSTLPLLHPVFQQRTAEVVSNNEQDDAKSAFKIELMSLWGIFQFKILLNCLLFYAFCHFNVRGIYYYVMTAATVIYYCIEVRKVFRRHYQQQERLLDQVMQIYRANNVVEVEEEIEVEEPQNLQGQRNDRGEERKEGEDANNNNGPNRNGNEAPRDQQGNGQQQQQPQEVQAKGVKKVFLAGQEFVLTFAYSIFPSWNPDDYVRARGGNPDVDHNDQNEHRNEGENHPAENREEGQEGNNAAVADDQQVGGRRPEGENIAEN
mmetsp:Transcript_93/g.82  ORF Transcript_93/g.82 Transcript_93/m.82 type:complete len:443 (-) Transcript_93:188-1516(-)